MRFLRITIATLAAFLVLNIRSASAATDSDLNMETEQQYASQFPAISIAPGPFTADENSLGQYRYPEWFRDAKLGIWAHWGPQSVPMEGDWYARRMYEPGDADYNDHLKRFGHPSQHGYKDIIPLWKAEKWNPDALMELYKKAGARYFVAQAVHHDNFDNWNSKYHRWNAVNMGPHRDVVGEWRDAAIRQGLRFGVSEHLGASFTWFQDAHRADKTGPFAGVPYDGADPRFFDLYHFPAAPDDTGWYSKDPLWQREWYARIKDLVDHYQPDLLYSDGGVAFGNDVGLSMIAHFYNTSAAAHGGDCQAVYTCKQNSSGRWVEDVERGVMANINPHPWQTDTSIGDWFYNRHWKYQSAKWVIQSLVDIVSKNGNLLINVVQRPDGTLDDDAEKIVQEMARWIAVNGEGIYGTRPWLVYGEGPSRARGGSFNEDRSFSASDIRFTARGDQTLYAFLLGWPDDQKLILHALSKLDGVTGRIDNVTLLGSDAKLNWSDEADGLHVSLPGKPPADYAVCLKIEGQNLNGFRPDLALPKVGVVTADSSGNFTLLPDDAQIMGTLHVETRGGERNLGFWSNPSDGPTWNLSGVAPGKYTVRIRYASEADSVLKTQVADTALSAALANTGSWDNYKDVDLGEISLNKSGDVVVHAGAVDAKTWQAINVRWIKLIKSASPQ